MRTARQAACVATCVFLGLLALLALVVPARAQDGPWSGAWDTSWPGGNGRIELQQHGSEVVGRYRPYDGRIAGKAAGDRLEGEWIEGDRRGHFAFVLGPLRQAFTGRSDDREWWTGARTSAQELRPEIRDDTPADTLRSFAIAGNVAASGYPDAIAEAARLVDFGAARDTLTTRQKVARAKALFDAVDLTTFRTMALTDPQSDGHSVNFVLPQAGSNATLHIRLIQTADRHWRIAAPSEEELAVARRALLARTGGRPPSPADIISLRTPRDTMRSFVDAMQHWDQGGSQRILEMMDLSGLRPAYRTEQALLQAQYMIRMISRIGAWQWQEIPDDPGSHEPYVFFSHTAGRIAIAPQGEGEQRRWRFTADTVNAQFALFAVTTNMPPAWGMPVPVPENGLFALRQRLLKISPWLLARGTTIPLENWQIIAFFVMLAGIFLATMLVVPVLIGLFRGGLRLLGQELDADFTHRLLWPLRLIAISLLWYRFNQKIGVTGPIMTMVDTGMAILGAIGVAWGGLPLIDALAGGFYGRASRTSGSLDDILVSLSAGLAKLALITGAALFVAQTLDIPVGGMLAGLGIGGLAVAFASKEALSNLFGAAILLVDRPFRNGDTIAIGDLQGTVEHVGIRSTRIRTMDDTVIVLPNGKLSDAMINNYGARRYRLFRTKFQVTYGTSPEKLESFTRRLRAVVDAYPSTAEDRTQVGLWQLGNEGIEVDLICYFRADTAAEERGARHELLLQVMQVAQDEGISFTTDGKGPSAAAPPATA